MGLHQYVIPCQTSGTVVDRDMTPCRWVASALFQFGLQQQVGAANVTRVRNSISVRGGSSRHSAPCNSTARCRKPALTTHACTQSRTHSPNYLQTRIIIRRLNDLVANQSVRQEFAALTEVIANSHAFTLSLYAWPSSLVMQMTKLLNLERATDISEEIRQLGNKW